MERRLLAGGGAEKRRVVLAVLDTRYAECERAALVCHNLNTHTTGAFYEAFELELARQYVRRLAFCRTPKHGS